MQLKDIAAQLPEPVTRALASSITELRPAQEKAIAAGLLDGKNLLVCTPTASGKTLIAELAMLKSILVRGGKAVYIVPLKALAAEKYRHFQQRYGTSIKVAQSSGDLDTADHHLAKYDLIIATAEKFDSLLRHQAPWISHVKVVVVDEIHLLNDPERGPRLEIVLTILKEQPRQIIGLSATIGNSRELAAWLQANLVVDDWRPVKLEKGVYLDGNVEFVE
ncbi:DEAD/DEAH box helicase [Candidatus Woesearchaeota archaeon]|nr:DEAD/DEAH box helicase [Candidatus Woesearchaeota archaeon]